MARVWTSGFESGIEIDWNALLSRQPPLFYNPPDGDAYLTYKRGNWRRRKSKRLREIQRIAAKDNSPA